MITEITEDLSPRAAKHAALGDPTRLQIADLLADGDATPGEVARRLGLPSNLLAHHLRTLEAAGLIVRKPSDADRRRSYLQLVHQALPIGLPRQRRRVGRIVFVCTANSARSQIALALWSTLSAVPVESAGTQPATAIDPRALATVERHGLTLAGRHPQPFDTVATHGDLVVTVCDLAHESMAERSDLHWSIPDPVLVGTRRAFEHAYSEIDARVSDLSARLTAS
jgi:ArsR family transcriptional regulator, arsenate/arsenite/antimonite-responsive transcriptional repressor / arsenate reductase (thioredoxin)